MDTQLLPPVTMPQLSGGRERARALTAPLKSRMQGEIVRLDCRDLIAGTASFADEIVQQVLIEAGAQRLMIEHGEGDFAAYLHDAAKERGVIGKIEFI